MTATRRARRQLFGLASLAVLMAVGVPQVARADVITAGTEHLAFDRPEAWAMKYFASATLLAGLEPPSRPDAGEVRLGVEFGNIPHLSPRQRTVGFNGTKTENLNKLPLIGRPRITVGLPLHLALAIAYVPPIPLRGARANLLSASLAREVLARGDFRLGAKLYGQLGYVTGDFTCPAEAVAGGADPEKNPYGCVEPSSDRSHLRYLGLELIAAYRVIGVAPYLAVAVNAMDLAFDVRARYSGIEDTTRLVTSGATFSSSAGVSVPLAAAWTLDIAAFYSPLTIHRPGEPTRSDGLLNARALVVYRLF